MNDELSQSRIYEDVKCLRVVDGDTLDLEFDLGFHLKTVQRVRLRDVNTPEVWGVKRGSEEYARGRRASEFVTELLFPPKKVWPLLRVETFRDSKGKYGRYLVNVYLPDGRNLKDILIAAKVGAPT